MILRIQLIFCALFLSLAVSAQQGVFQGIELNYPGHSELERQFTDYQVYRIDADALDTYVKDDSERSDKVLSMKLGDDHEWNIHLSPFNFLAPNYRLVEMTEQGKRINTRVKSNSFKGFLLSDPSSKVTLTLDKDFIYGMVKKGNELFFIEPLQDLIGSGDPSLFIVYNSKDVIADENATCGYSKMLKHKDQVDHEGHDHEAQNNVGSRMGCKEVEMAVAADFSMFVKYGTAAATQNRIFGVMANVQTNYDDEFNDQLIFLIVEVFISSCNTCDPWTNSTGAGTVLNSFTNWGQSGGFSVTYDIAQFWTNRNFNGGTIGIAWLASVCTSSRYHAVQDFSNNAQLMRVLVAHEIGHNFGSGHDASGAPFIMAPSVNTSNDWSPNSENAINNFVASRTCLSNCNIVQPPVSDFTSDVVEGCAPLTVNFFDQSTNSPDSWQWVFPGGTPSISTQQNPTVTYTTPGTYDVSLTASNSAGGNTVTKTGYIFVDGPPVAAFNTFINLNTVDFINLTTNADSYIWDFGDGNISTLTNPTHTYVLDGFYNITLTATNGCGSDIAVIVIEIVTEPFASFRADVTEACDSLTVQFIDQSTPNVTDWEWSFPGGVPDTSSLQNPTITYTTPGTYSVTLIVSNAAGLDVLTRTDYITIGASATADFDFTLNGLMVDFIDNSSGANSLLWDFGDGNSSTEMNPTHTYAGGGSYLVSMIAYGDTLCPPDTLMKTVDIALMPTAAFTADTTEGCATLTVNFVDESTAGITGWEWRFPGGSPAGSNEQFPIVEYENPGLFDVTLIVENALGKDTLLIEKYIAVDTIPTADFDFEIDADLVTVHFSDSSSYADSLFWDFGDGTMSRDTNPDHTYGDDGVYTVELIIKNECGADTLEKDVTIVTLPSAAFSADANSGCTPFAVQFTNESSTNATTWNWSFPGGTPSVSSDENPSVTYNTAGIYDVTLIVSNAAGSDTTQMISLISVGTTPTAGFSSSANGLTVDFTNTSTNANSYSWDFGDSNSSTMTNPSHSYASDGTYIVVLTATNDCGSVTSTETIIIVTAPNGNFTSNIQSGCSPLTVQYTDQSSANTTSWNWTFPGGTPSSSTAQNPVIVYNTAGTFDATLQVSNAAGTDQEVKAAYINIETVPAASFTTQTNNRQAFFTNTTSNANSYLWDFGDGNTSTTANPDHTFGADGSFLVQLTATNGCGSITVTETVIISTSPTSNFTANVQSGCSPLTVQYSDQSSLNTSTWSWSFPGGTPSSSTDPNPTVTYSAAGTYNVSLEVGNASGTDTEEKLGYIIVNTVPVASFTAAVSGTNANFTNGSTNATSYSWDFGDGNSSTASNPSHSYAGDGTYTVKLTATNECGSVEFTETVVVVTLPDGGFTASERSGCSPMTVQFTNQSSLNTTAWSWSFPGGTPATSSDANPVVVYNTSGTYTVSLEVSNAAGTDQVIETNYITVNTVPSASFVASVNGTDASFTNGTTNANSYSWDFGDGNSSVAANPMHTYAGDGTYTVKLTATNECGSVEFTETVVVVTLPNGGFTASVQSGCAPLTVQYSNQSSLNTTAWSWSFPGGTPANSTDANPVVVYDTPGTYNVSLEVSNAAGTDQVAQTNYIVVGTAPDVSFTTQILGTQANFTNGSSNATSYSWDFGDGNTSTETNPSHDYPGDGTYTVKLTATNECGSTESSQIITIITPPDGGFTADTQTGCSPLTVQFSDQSSANTTGWSWSFPGGTPATSTAQNPVVEYATPGTYNVSLVVSNPAGNDQVSQTSYIVVESTPTPDFSSANFGSTVNFNNTSVNANSFLWTFGDGNSSSDVNPSHTYASDGTYVVSLTAANECGEVTIEKEVIVVTPPDAGFSANNQSGCAPMTVQFNDLSSSNTTGWSWSFPGGTPATSTDQNPTVVYNTPGTYDVTLIASTSAGTNSFSQMAYINIVGNPDAGFSSSGVGTITNFTNSSTGASSYSWDFGDGNSSTDVNPEHTYATDGVYTVVLTATNECGSTMISETVTIVTPPTAGFAASSTSGCAPMTVEYTNQSSANTTSWTWTFNGGTPATSSDPNPTVTYNTPGVYAVRLVAANSAGDNTFEQLSYIEVGTGPTAGFTTAVMDNRLTTTNTSQNGDTYLWDFGDGNSSTSSDPEHNYSASGQYEVTLIVTNDCGSDTITQTITVTVVSLPVAQFSANTTDGCAPVEVTFTDESSSNTTSWNWTFPGGTPATSTDQNPTVTYSTPGTYEVTLVAGNSAGSDMNQKMGFITIDGPPTADFSSMTNITVVDFANVSAGGMTYFWNFGDGTTSMEENPMHDFGINGTYLVTLIATNACGSDTTEQEVVISLGVGPLAGLSASANSGCAPLEVSFSDQSQGDPDTWAWTFGGGTPGTSSDQNPVVTFTTAGSYDVELIVTNANGKDTITFENYIVVEAEPVAEFNFTADQGEVSFDNTSKDGDTYLWDFGDGVTSMEEMPVYTYGGSGTYEVTLIVTNDCGSDTTMMTVTIEITGTTDPEYVEEFLLYPNPNDGNFTFLLKGEARDWLEVSMYNVLGQRVYVEELDFRSGNLVKKFGFDRLASGTYLLQIRSDNELMHRKVVIDK